MTATVHRDCPAACSFRLNTIDRIIDRYFTEVFKGFRAPWGTCKGGANGLRTDQHS